MSYMQWVPGHNHQAGGTSVGHNPHHGIRNVAYCHHALRGQHSSIGYRSDGDDEKWRSR